jgi:hypothetical protein
MIRPSTIQLQGAAGQTQEVFMQTERLSAYEAAPAAMRAIQQVEAYIQQCGLEESLIELVKMRAAFDGWPTSPRIESLRAAWLDAGNFDEQRQICAELQMQLWQDVPYIPMGEYWQSTAYRKDLLDVLPGCFAVFYGVRRG